VPGNDDGPADRRGAARRNHQDGPAALEKRVLERRLGQRGKLRRLLDDDEVEDTPEGPDPGVLPPLLLAPLRGRPALLNRRAERNVLRAHHLAKDPPRLIAPFLAL